MKIICIARNYAAHAAELHHDTGLDTGDRAAAQSGNDPQEEHNGHNNDNDTDPLRITGPVFFLKPDTALLLRNNDPFYIPLLLARDTLRVRACGEDQPSGQVHRPPLRAPLL